MDQEQPPMLHLMLTFDDATVLSNVLAFKFWQGGFCEADMVDVARLERMVQALLDAAIEDGKRDE